MKNRPNLHRRPEFRFGFKQSLGVLAGLGLLLALAYTFFPRQSRRGILHEEDLSRKLEEEVISRPSFVLFTTTHCYPCQRLEERMKASKEFTDFIERHFDLYRIDGRDSYTAGIKLAQRYGIRTFPSLLITDNKGRELTRLPVPGSPELWMESLIQQKGLGIKAGGKIKDVIDKETRKNKEFGLLYRSSESWEESRGLLRYLKKNWNQEIWVHPRQNEGYDIIIGRFGDKKMARITRKFLRLWEGEQAPVVKLEDKALTYKAKGKFYPALSHPTEEEVMEGNSKR